MQRFFVAHRWEILLVVGLYAPTWGFWVLLVSGPLDISGLVFDFVWWVLVLVLPALVMAGLYMRMRGRGYGWEGLLLVAIPFWTLRAEVACQALVFRSLLVDSERWRGLALGLLDWRIPDQFVTVILLTALYPAAYVSSSGYRRSVLPPLPGRRTRRTNNSTSHVPHVGLYPRVQPADRLRGLRHQWPVPCRTRRTCTHPTHINCCCRVCGISPSLPGQSK